MDLTHAECLEVLKVLEDKFEGRAAKAEAEARAKASPDFTLADLVRRVQKKGRVETSELTVVVAHELRGLKQRLAALEKAVLKKE